MKWKKSYVLFLCLLLALDFLALDDITTGNEPDFTLKYAVLIASAVCIPLFIYLWKKHEK